MATVRTVRVCCLPCLSQSSAASALGGGCIPTMRHRPLACPWHISLSPSAASMDFGSKGGECYGAVCCAVLVVVLSARAAVTAHINTATTKAHDGGGAHSACALLALPVSVVC